MADRPSAADGPTADLHGLERAIELALFAPFTLCARTIEELPGLARRTSQRLTMARALGMMAVRQGTTELRRRIDAQQEDREPVTSSRARAGADAGVDRSDGAEPVGDASGSAATDATPPGNVPVDAEQGHARSDVPTAEELALPDYDHLPAAHIVEKLSTLSPSERELIEAYEEAHRHRRTVLGKIAQLREAE